MLGCFSSSKLIELPRKVGNKSRQIQEGTQFGKLDKTNKEILTQGEYFTKIIFTQIRKEKQLICYISLSVYQLISVKVSSFFSAVHFLHLVLIVTHIILTMPSILVGYKHDMFKNFQGMNTAKQNGGRRSWAGGEEERLSQGSRNKNNCPSEVQ